ncbi:uncharacterized protein DS421_18g634180 [Arachis hypogaea]|nr:uncharacterized protein DS421_18g634180 [Arachis hypogaea]
MIQFNHKSYLTVSSYFLCLVLYFPQFKRFHLFTYVGMNFVLYFFHQYIIHSIQTLSLSAK